jgi:hypothetical protein
MRSGMYLMRRVPFALCALALASCGTQIKHSPQPPTAHVGRSTGTMHVVLTAPRAATYDLANATCLIAARGSSAGGVHVAGQGSGDVLAAAIEDTRSDGNDTDDWAAGQNASALRAPIDVRLTLSDGTIFSGGAGSSAKFQTTGNGASGSVAFTGATFAGKSGVSDASGTIAWTCAPT